jgi:D-3-phosphoglycerate dehydrogenase / 2-oxoglutarate reductase
MKLKGILFLMLPTPGDEGFYKRWENLGPLHVDQTFAHDEIDAIVTDQHTVITNDLLSYYPNVKYVISPNTAHTHLKFTKENIEIISLRGENDFLKGVYSVSEFTMYLILRLAREKEPRHLLRDKKLGIIGMGRIGRHVYDLANAFGLRLVGYDFPSTDTHLKYIFETSDIVSIHLSETPKTKGMINRELLFSMKKGSFFINTARASIVDEEALVEALYKRVISRAALDVYSDERFKNHYNVILTDHIAGHTIEDRIRTDEFIIRKAQNVISKLEGSRHD